MKSETANLLYEWHSSGTISIKLTRFWTSFPLADKFSDRLLGTYLPDNYSTLSQVLDNI